MTEKELLVYWQNRLELNDWKIVLNVNAKPDEFVLKDVDGECEWQEVNRFAVIRILDRKYYGDRFLKFNFERTLVHELLHLKFAILDESRNPLQNRIVHNLIGSLSRALVSEEKENEDK